MLLHLLTISFMSCTTVNNKLFCAEPVSTQVSVSVPLSKIESLESQKYSYVPDISYSMVTKAIYSAPNHTPAVREGCKMTTTAGKEYYFGDNCAEFKNGLRRLEDN